MGILIRWKISTDSDVTYDKTYIYRADSEGGTYAELTNQNISDNVYFDKDGTTSKWYKVRFKDTANNVWSDFSESMQGGTFYGYCTISDIRNLCGLTTTDISDSILYDLLQFSMAQINADLNVNIVREKVEYIDDTRENLIDDSNTTYYVKFWKDFYLGDLDNDGDVDTSDVEVIGVDSDDVEHALTVSSVTHDEGKIVLSSAPPSTYKLYITYARSPVDESTPNTLVKLAAAQLTAALSFTNLTAKNVSKFRVGKIAVTQQSEGYEKLFSAYQNTLNRIRRFGVEIGEGKIIIAKRSEE